MLCLVNIMFFLTSSTSGSSQPPKMFCNRSLRRHEASIDPNVHPTVWHTLLPMYSNSSMTLINSHLSMGLNVALHPLSLIIILALILRALLLQPPHTVHTQACTHLTTIQNYSNTSTCKMSLLVHSAGPQ